MDKVPKISAGQSVRNITRLPAEFVQLSYDRIEHARDMRIGLVWIGFTALIGWAIMSGIECCQPPEKDANTMMR